MALRGVASKHLLSGSTDGKGIKIAATSSPGDTVHTAVSGSSEIDWIYLQAVNEDVDEIEVVVEWGGTTDVDNSITVTLLQESGLQPLMPDRLGLNNGLLVKVYAAVTNKVVVYGDVTRTANE